MLCLSWPGVCACFDALRVPKRKGDAVRAVAEAGDFRPSTAYEYLRLASRLGLVVDRDGRHGLAVPARAPEALLESSTLIRLFHARARGGALPVRPFNRKDNPFAPFRVGEIAVLRSAEALSRRLRGIDEALPRTEAMILEMTRLWGEGHKPSAAAPPLSAAVAFHLFVRLEGPPALLATMLAQEFVRGCMYLYSKKLVRLSIVQYADDNNRPFAQFRTSLGYIKWIHSPVPHRGARDAEPVQTPRKLVSVG